MNKLVQRGLELLLAIGMVGGASKAEATSCKAIFDYHKSLKEKIEVYDSVLKEDSSFVPAYLNKANAFSSMFQYKEALDNYNQVLERLPENIDALEGRTDALIFLDRYDEAIETARKVSDKVPDYVPGRFNLAFSLYMADKLDEALEHFSIAANYKDDFFYSYNAVIFGNLGMGNILLDKKEYIGAMVCYDIVLEIMPGHPWVIERRNQARDMRAEEILEEDKRSKLSGLHLKRQFDYYRKVSENSK